MKSVATRTFIIFLLPCVKVWHAGTVCLMKQSLLLEGVFVPPLMDVLDFRFIEVKCSATKRVIFYTEMAFAVRIYMSLSITARKCTLSLVIVHFWVR